VGAAVLLGISLGAAAAAHAARGFPPWSDPNDIPIPRWAKSVAPHGDDAAVFAQPTRLAARRGSLSLSARPSLYGAARGPGCGARWLQIGPASWVCSDEVELSPDDPTSFVPPPALLVTFPDDGLPFYHAFVGPEGASGFRNLDRAEEDGPEADFEPGFAVAIVEEQVAHGERWGRTRHGVWIALRELNPAPPATLRGAMLREGEGLTVAWVLPEVATTYATYKADKRAGSHMRFDHVHPREEKKGPQGVMVRISDEGATQEEWMRRRDLALPTIAEPPMEVGGQDARVRWIDVDLASQTLLAYEGTRPVYAALVSTGRGPQGSETATPVGVHRIWAKLATSTMSNLGDEEAESHYSIEDVPYVQFFAKGVAIHGTFWHRSFGTPHSHGCVNITPVDARWLFEFTAPQLHAGWSAVLPVGETDPGTVVRVR
jgi:lipoprotein-anchoring transpeptidase ErfK/SrfK